MSLEKPSQRHHRILARKCRKENQMLDYELLEFHVTLDIWESMVRESGYDFDRQNPYEHFGFFCGAKVIIDPAGTFFCKPKG